MSGCLQTFLLSEAIEELQGVAGNRPLRSLKESYGGDASRTKNRNLNAAEACGIRSFSDRSRNGKAQSVIEAQLPSASLKAKSIMAA